MKKSVFTALKIIAALVVAFVVLSIMSTYFNRSTEDRILSVLCYEDCDAQQITVKYNKTVSVNFGGRDFELFTMEESTTLKDNGKNWFGPMPLKKQNYDMEYTIVVAEGAENEYTYVLEVPADAKWTEVCAVLQRSGDSYALTSWEYHY